MQIQRLQTLWLVLALACMAAFICLPFGSLELPGEGVAMLHSYNFMGLIIPAGFAAVFQLVAIFAYKNPTNQRSIVVLACMMSLVAVGITIYILCDSATQGVIEWQWPSIFAFCSFLLSLLAIRGINHDIKLLRSYDRLR